MFFRLSPNFKFSSLTVDDIPQILEVTNHEGNLSYSDFLKNAINFYPSTAIFDGSKLITWCLMADTGEMSNMVVREDYRQKQLGINLTCRHALKIIDHGKIPFGFVDTWNEKSFKMLMKIGGNWVGNFRNLGVRKVAWEGKPHKNWYQM